MVAKHEPDAAGRTSRAGASAPVGAGWAWLDASAMRVAAGRAALLMGVVAAGLLLVLRPWSSAASGLKLVVAGGSALLLLGALSATTALAEVAAERRSALRGPALLLVLGASFVTWTALPLQVSFVSQLADGMPPQDALVEVVGVLAEEPLASAAYVAVWSGLFTFSFVLVHNQRLGRSPTEKARGQMGRVDTLVKASLLAIPLVCVGALLIPVVVGLLVGVAWAADQLELRLRQGDRKSVV